MEKAHVYSKVVLITLLLASAILGLLRFDSFQVGAFSDDAHYIVLAESLASGQGYRLINFPNPPREWAFPPGWPLLLSPFAFLFPGNFTVFKILSFALWLGSLFLVYRIFAKRIKTPYLELLTTLIALNPVLIGMSGMVMSEAAYLFFSLLTFYLLDLWDEDHGKSQGWTLIASAISALYAQLIRTAGLSILLAVIAYLVLSRRFRHIWVVITIFSLGMLPQIWLNSQGDGSLVSSSYQAQVFNSSIPTKFIQMWANLQAYSGQLIASSLIPVFSPSITAIFSKLRIGIMLSLINISILVLIALGILLSFKRFRSSDIYVCIYSLVILTFWTPEVGGAQPRFLLPIIPFLYLYLFQAITWLVRWIFAQRNKQILVVVTGLTSLIVLILLARNIQDWRDPIRNRMTDLTAGNVWINQNTPLESIIMVPNPVPDYLYARRRTVAYPSNGEDIEENIKINNVDYIIISPKLRAQRSKELDDYTKTHLLPLIASSPDAFTVVYTDIDHNVTIYKRLTNNP